MADDSDTGGDTGGGRAGNLKEEVEKSSRENRNTLRSALTVFATYSLFTAANTTDLQLLKPDSTLTLPLLNISVPLIDFYLFIPLIVFAVHMNLLVNLYCHSRKFHKLMNAMPKPPQSGNAAGMDVFRFVFDFDSEACDIKYFRYLLAVAAMLAYVSPVIVLIYISYKFLPYHSTPITNYHKVVTILDFLALALIWPNITGTLGKRPLKPVTRVAVKALWIIALLWGCVFLTSVIAVPQTGDERLPVPFITCETLQSFPLLSQLCHTDTLSGPSWRTRVFRIRLSDVLHRNLSLQNQTLVVKEPSDVMLHAYLNSSNSRKEKDNAWSDTQWDDAAWYKYAKGFNLAGRNLDFADFGGSNLFRVNLEGASAKRANFSSANMKYASLDVSSNLAGAVLYNANLGGADLQKSNLQGANLALANLAGANLSLAHLQGAVLYKAAAAGADLSYAELEGVNLQEANLAGTNLQGANLQGADLSYATLTGADFGQANLGGAILTAATMQGTNLSSAGLEGADLYGAKLQGANLTKAKFKATYLQRAQVKCSRFDGAIKGVFYTDIDAVTPYDFTAQVNTMKKAQIHCEGQPPVASTDFDTYKKDLITVAATNIFVAKGIVRQIDNHWDERIIKEKNTLYGAIEASVKKRNPEIYGELQKYIMTLKGNE